MADEKVKVEKVNGLVKSIKITGATQIKTK